VDGLVDIDRTADARRREHSECARQRRRFVREYVAEHVLGEHHVEARGVRNEEHRARVDVEVLELDVGIVACDSHDDVAPESRYLEDVRLVDRRDSVSPAPCGLERDARDALHLALGVPQRVNRVRRRGVGDDTAWRAEIETSEELSHDEDVGAANDVRPERRAFDERVERAGRSHVREGSARRSKREKSGFGARVRRKRVERGRAHGTEQDGVAREHAVERFGRERGAESLDGGSPDRVLREREVGSRRLSNGAEHAERLLRDLRPDSVAA
jgi:hypothetical protein